MRVLSFDLGTRNMGCAVLNRCDACGTIHIETAECVDILVEGGCTAKNSRKIPNETILKCVLNFVRTRTMDQNGWRLLDLDAVTLESQVRKNSKCKLAMYVLMAWFMNAYMDAGLSSRKMPKIVKISAKNKLATDISRKRKFDEIDEPEAPPVSTAVVGKKGQPQRKKDSIAMVQFLIDGKGRPFRMSASALQAWHKAGKKKDDIADAVMQTIWFMDNRMPITQTVTPTPMSQVVNNDNLSISSSTPQSSEKQNSDQQSMGCPACRSFSSVVQTTNH